MCCILLDSPGSNWGHSGHLGKCCQQDSAPHAHGSHHCRSVNTEVMERTEAEMRGYDVLWGRNVLMWTPLCYHIFLNLYFYVLGFGDAYLSDLCLSVVVKAIQNNIWKTEQCVFPEIMSWLLSTHNAEHNSNTSMFCGLSSWFDISWFDKAIKTQGLLRRFFWNLHPLHGPHQWIEFQLSWMCTQLTCKLSNCYEFTHNTFSQYFFNAVEDRKQNWGGSINPIRRYLNTWTLGLDSTMDEGKTFCNLGGGTLQHPLCVTTKCLQKLIVYFRCYNSS